MPAHRLRLPCLLVAALLCGCAEGSTGLGINLVPEEQVNAMGKQAWEQVRADTPASTNADYQHRARRVAERVLKAAGEDPRNWEVEVFASDQVNAFALPGRKIGVYEGMLRTASSDEELAAVIGHEVGHVEAKHSAERVNTQAVTELGVNVLETLLGGSNAQMVAGVLGAGAQYGIILPYSRNQELQADQIGLHYMARAGYDPHGAIRLWQKMAKAGGQPPAFLSTHPATEERIRALEAKLPEATREYQAATRG